MSLDIDDSGTFSRIQLAKALKEDPDNLSEDLPEKSAIFLRQRARKSDAPAGQFYIPRPISLLTPPILGTTEPQNNEPRHPQEDRRNSTYPPNTNIRGSVITPLGHEERRGSQGKPATLLDVRKSMLDARQSIHNMLPFSPASSHRTSQILHQHKSLPDLSLARQSPGPSRLSNVSTSNSNSRKNSLATTPSRPTSSINPASRPNSMFKSNKSFIPQDSEDSSSSSDHRQRLSPKSLKSKSKSKSKSKKSASSKPGKSKHKKVVDGEELFGDEPTGEQSTTNKSAKKNKHAPKVKLEKVKEEDSDDSEETDEEEDDADDDGSDSEEDDTPLALKNTPKIRVAAPNGTVMKNGGRIEAWLDTVSAQSPIPEPDINVRHRRPPSGYNQTPSSPLGHGYRSSLAPEPALASGNRRPRSSTEDFHPPEPQFRSQPRKRANSEYEPKRNSHMPEPQFMQVGRISPSPRQDSGYWARDTLAALSGDVRHLSLMNDSSSNFSNKSESAGSARYQHHQREGSGSSLFGSRPHSPQVPSPTSPYSRSKDSLNVSPSNRQSYYMTNNNVHRRGSSEHLANRFSHYQQSPLPQQKHKVR